MFDVLYPSINLWQTLKDLFLKAADKDEDPEDKPDKKDKSESEDMPKWAKNFLETLKPKIPPKDEESTKIPTPDEPLTEEEQEEELEEEEQEEQQKRPTLGQRIANFLF